MNIHEQIIAFLDGELHDESQVAELLHVLAVAPEKRHLLLDQVKLRRSYATLGGGLASPVAVDMAILQGLDTIDAGFPSAPISPPTPAPAQVMGVARFFRYHPMLVSSVASLLLVIGGVIGYLFATGEKKGFATASASGPTVPSAAASVGTPSPSDMVDDLVVKGLRDSLALLQSRYGALMAPSVRRPMAHRSTISAATSADGVARMQPYRRAADTAMLSATSSPIGTPIALRSVHPDGDLGSSSDRISMRSPSQMEGRPVTEEDLAVVDRVWQIGLRSNFRLSFPRVYGIESSTNALTDREVVATRRFESGDLGLQMPLRLGVAVGGTQFSETFRATGNTSGTIEQTPNFIYGRGFIAPEIISSESWGGALELGAGGTVVGPFVTLGLGLEYRAMDRVSMDLGVSSWLLWTKLEQQSIMSTNLNAHVGAAMWFSFDEIFQ